MVREIRLVCLCLGASIAGALWCGCAVYRASTPATFARYPTTSGHRSVSPEGVMYSLRQVKNKPFAQLPFWREAMRTQMEKAGYIVVKDTVTMVDGIEAGLLELATPIANVDYSYLIAIAVHRKKIVIAEAAADMTLYQKKKEQILKAIGQIDLR